MNAEDIHILLVEDEVDLAEMVRDYLLAENFQVEMRHSGADVVEHVQLRPPHLILLDLMLPGKDGISICREIRQFSDVPIIMVTARAEEIDRLLGLELGADDYICKPARPREIVARVKAVLRRTLPRDSAKQNNKRLLLDEQRLFASLDGKAIDLTLVEFKLLKLLVSVEGKIFSRQEIIRAIYSDNRVISERSIDSHIKKLRRKIEDVIDGDNPVQSVYGVGFKWELP
jgi:two-component system response regulator BaeR